jgi:cytochrome bd-type quinol oxidase subunit 2
MQIQMSVTTVNSTVSTLTWDQVLVALLVVTAAVLLAGLIVLWMRNNMKERDPASSSMMRSWLAIALVMGLLLFTVFSFGVEDESLRSTLIGAVAASAGSVIAFYFASKSADQARQDILSSVFPTVSVPDLTGQSKDTAQANLLHAQLAMTIGAGSSEATEATVKTQAPAAHSQARPGSSVELNLQP